MQIPGEGDITSVLKRGDVVVAFFTSEEDARVFHDTLNEVHRRAPSIQPYWVADFVPDDPRDDPDSDAD